MGQNARFFFFFGKEHLPIFSWNLIIPSFEDIANLTMENNYGICRLQILDLYPIKIGVI